MDNLFQVTTVQIQLISMIVRFNIRQ